MDCQHDKKTVNKDKSRTRLVCKMFANKSCLFYKKTKMEETRPNTFPKKEHLCGESALTYLFKKGSCFLSYPVKITYMEVEDNEPVRILFVAPKKKFKHAVDRNRVKRQLREAYRKNKHELVDWATNNNKQLHIGMMFVDNQLLPSHVIEKKMKSALAKILEKVQQ